MALIQLRRTNCKSLDNVKLNRASFTAYCFLSYSLFLVCLPPRIYVYCLCYCGCLMSSDLARKKYANSIRST